MDDTPKKTFGIPRKLFIEQTPLFQLVTCEKTNTVYYTSLLHFMGKNIPEERRITKEDIYLMKKKGSYTIEEKKRLYFMWQYLGFIPGLYYGGTMAEVLNNQKFIPKFSLAKYCTSNWDMTKFKEDNSKLEIYVIIWCIIHKQHTLAKELSKNIKDQFYEDIYWCLCIKYNCFEDEYLKTDYLIREFYEYRLDLLRYDEVDATNFIEPFHFRDFISIGYPNFICCSQMKNVFINTANEHKPSPEEEEFYMITTFTNLAESIRSNRYCRNNTYNSLNYSIFDKRLNDEYFYDILDVFKVKPTEKIEVYDVYCFYYFRNELEKYSKYHNIRVRYIEKLGMLYNTLENFRVANGLIYQLNVNILFKVINDYLDDLLKYTTLEKIQTVNDYILSNIIHSVHKEMEIHKFITYDRVFSDASKDYLLNYNLVNYNVSNLYFLITYYKDYFTTEKLRTLIRKDKIFNYLVKLCNV
jgi:hypothetical protein